MPLQLKLSKNNARHSSLIEVGGTWWRDSQNLLPVFYRLVDKSSFPDNKITLIGVDRDKTAPIDLVKTYKISYVWTFNCGERSWWKQIKEGRMAK